LLKDYSFSGVDKGPVDRARGVAMQLRRLINDAHEFSDPVCILIN